MGRLNKRTYFGDSTLNRLWTDNIYISRLIELWCAMLEYDNLPDTCDARYMEMQMLLNGAVVYFRDDVVGDLCLNMVPQSGFDLYGEPRKRRAYSRYNNYQAQLDETNSVIIWNNLLRRPCVDVLVKYGLAISELDAIIMVNAKAQKTPILIQGTEKQRLSLVNLYERYEGNMPVIFGEKDLSATPLKSIDTGAIYSADKLYALKTQIWNEALTYMGVSNINIEKHERLITDEVTRNLGGTIASRYSRLEARNNALNKINKMFGTNISVKYRQDFDVLVDNVAPKKPDNAENAGNEDFKGGAGA